MSSNVKIIGILSAAIILSSCLSSCAQPPAPNNINLEFQMLYNRFIADAKSSAGLDFTGPQALTIQFTPLEQQTSLGEVIGDCVINGSVKTINIDPTFWNSTTYSMQFILIYHELGHCLLNEGHTPDPMAIMNPVINNPDIYYGEDLGEMVEQLFLNQMVAQ